LKAGKRPRREDDAGGSSVTEEQSGFKNLLLKQQEQLLSGIQSINMASLSANRQGPAKAQPAAAVDPIVRHMQQKLDSSQDKILDLAASEGYHRGKAEVLESQQGRLSIADLSELSKVFQQAPQSQQQPVVPGFAPNLRTQQAHYNNNMHDIQSCSVLRLHRDHTHHDLGHDQYYHGAPHPSLQQPHAHHASRYHDSDDYRASAYDDDYQPSHIASHPNGQHNHYYY
jgi:hypothetical protein